jgi:hypothetical protein
MTPASGPIRPAQSKRAEVGCHYDEDGFNLHSVRLLVRIGLRTLTGHCSKCRAAQSHILRWFIRLKQCEGCHVNAHLIWVYSQFKKVVTLKKGGNTDKGCEMDDFDPADPGGCSPEASNTSI